MVDIVNCEPTNWLAEGLGDEEIEQIKTEALEEARREFDALEAY